MTERVRCNPELVCIYGFGQVCFWINQWRFGQVCFCYATWWAQLLFRFRFFMGFYLGPSIGQCSHLYQRKKITITSQSQPSKSGWNLRPILGDQILRISQFFLVDKEATDGKKSENRNWIKPKSLPQAKQLTHTWIATGVPAYKEKQQRARSCGTQVVTCGRIGCLEYGESSKSRSCPSSSSSWSSRIE